METLISVASPETPEDARRFGEYQLLEEIGRGGVGAVYRAWHARLERTVALKMLLGGAFAGPEITARFEREVKMVARLRHPGIVGLFESGETEGIRYFTMELVEGRTLASIVRDGPLSPKRASAYVRKAAIAVGHAHDHLILHRDLKPSNILVDLFDEPKVADFGLARLWTSTPEQTVGTTAMGSPPYMAPEQISGPGDTTGPRTDVYALGAVLYHLLTGKPPHQGASVEEVLAHVRAEAVAAPRLLNPSVPRDLETICLKCLEKDPARRYNSALDLSDDLARFERGEPVQARPVGAWGHAWRWSRRNRLLAGALATLFLVLLAGAVGVGVQAARNQREQQRLEVERYVTGVESSSLAAAAGDYPLSRSTLSSIAPPATRSDLRGFEWRLLWAMTASQAERTFHPHRQAIAQVAFFPDGRRLATNSFDQTAGWFDGAPDSGSSLHGLGPGGGWTLALTPSGTACYVGTNASSDMPGRVRLVDIATGATLWSVIGWRASLSSDGTRLAVTLGQPLPWAPAHGGAEIWNTVTRERLLTLEGDFRSVAISPDGTLAALAASDNSVRLRSAIDGRELARLETSGPQATVALSPDGSFVASSGLGEASLWRVADHSLVARLPHPWLRVWSVAFSPDSSLLATTCSDRAVRLWDTKGGTVPRILRGHPDEVWSAAFSPDGKVLASGGKDGSLMLWSVNSQRESSDIPCRGWSRPLFSGDGNTLVLTETGSAPTAHIQRAGRAEMRGPAGWCACGISRDGSQLLLWSAETSPFLRLWDIGRRTFGASFQDAEDMGGHLAIQSGLSGDGSRIFQLTKDGKLVIWDASGGSPKRSLQVLQGSFALRAAVISPDARWFGWSLTDERRSWIADIATGAIRVLLGHREMINSIAFSPSSSEMATASSDGSVRLWDCAGGLAVAELAAHPESADDVAYSPDGRTLATLGTFQSLKLWHLGTHRELLTMAMPEAGSFLAFSPDGHRLAVTLGDPDSGGDRGARVLEATPQAAEW